MFSGVKNISALGYMVNWQKVEYDFDFHKQDFVCNVSALILSEGKSILPVRACFFCLSCLLLCIPFVERFNIFCNEGAKGMSIVKRYIHVAYEINILFVTSFIFHLKTILSFSEKERFFPK